MLRRFVLFSIITGLLILLPPLAQAQDTDWTCDDGPNDALNAAQVAYDAGDSDRAYELAQIAVDACSNGSMGSLMRHSEALMLQNRLGNESTATFTLVNGFDASICYVYFGFSTDPDWGVNQLDSTEVIQSEGERNWVITRGIYDVRLLDCDEETITTVFQLAITRDYQWEASLDFIGRFSEAQELIELGWDASDQGRYDEALAHFEQAFLLARKNGDRIGEAHALGNIGWIYDVQKKYSRALDSYEQALSIYRETGDRTNEGFILSSIGVVYANRGQQESALGYYEQALTIAREVDDRLGEAIILHNQWC